jgi:hypothetical protein
MLTLSMTNGDDAGSHDPDPDPDPDPDALLSAGKDDDGET